MDFVWSTACHAEPDGPRISSAGRELVLASNVNRRRAEANLENCRIYSRPAAGRRAANNVRPTPTTRGAQRSSKRVRRRRRRKGRASSQPSGSAANLTNGDHRRHRARARSSQANGSATRAAAATHCARRLPTCRRSAVLFPASVLSSSRGNMRGPRRAPVASPRTAAVGARDNGGRRRQSPPAPRYRAPRARRAR